MDQWSAHSQNAGGGYFNDDNVPGSETKKTTARRQFCCPVSIRQVLDAPEDGIKVGEFTATMVSIMGVVTNVEVSSTNIKFTISDDTGVIECLDWIESEDTIASKKMSNIMEGAYYQVFGTVKSPQGRRRLMAFKVNPIEDLNELSAFIMEVISADSYAKKKNQTDYTMPITTPMETSSMSTVQMEFNSALTPAQRAVLDAIKGSSSQIGWNKDDAVMKSKFPPKVIEDALEYLICEGHIYSTVDDNHFCSTG